MGKRVLDTIIEQVKTAKFYSISIDSTPDASKVDRCTCILRYIPECGNSPVERFLKFLDMEGHTAQQLTDTLIQFLDNVGIDITNCRGQSYDNASNMSGKYHSVQAIIRERNPLAVYIPCFGHSLNLVGTAAVENVPMASAFFFFIQNIYNFLSASTHRWSILTNLLQGTPVVKTRWSARADATDALMRGYRQIKQALATIEQDEKEKGDTRREAAGFISKMERLEYGILTMLWATILQQFNKTNMALQNLNLDLNSAVQMLQSLKTYTQTLRDQFDEIEGNGKDKSGSEVFKEEASRKRKRSIRITRFEGQGEEIHLSPRETFRTQVYIPIIDNLTAALAKRLDAYTAICNLFGFLHKLMTLEPDQIRLSARDLVNIYHSDLEPCLADELVQFTEFAKLQRRKITDSSHSIELELYQIATQIGVRETFPNVEVALRIYLSLLVSNCSGDRSFSTLSRVKNTIRTSMGDERLNKLALLSIESDLLKSLDFKDVIADFACLKARKAKCLSGIETHKVS